MPLSADFSASSLPAGPSITFQAWAWLENRKGMPKAAYSGTTLATAPCELADMSSAPVRSAVTIAASSPSCAAPATVTSMRPALLALTTSANFSDAVWRGVVQSGAVGQRELDGLRRGGAGQQGSGQCQRMNEEGLALHGLVSLYL